MKKQNSLADWILRFVKGMFVGTGFILPGVSGGALAAIFGIYERIITFLAHITRNFKENVLFLMPVGFGLIAGIFLLSFPISFLLNAYEVQVLWFFIGCILGTLPLLWKQAGRKGRKPKHLGAMAVSFVLSFILLICGEGFVSGGSIPQSIGSWVVVGAVIGLGVIVPGLSPSNFLVYMGMYEPMTTGIKTLDFAVIIPIGIGAAVCVLLLSRLMDYIFHKAYSGLFHCILGVVFSSTLMIVPRGYNYLSAGALLCLLLCAAGVALGYWMGTLEERYKPE